MVSGGKTYLSEFYVDVLPFPFRNLFFHKETKNYIWYDSLDFLSDQMDDK